MKTQAILAGVLLGIAPLTAQENVSAIPITITPVSGSVHLLVGRGGNIAISSGPDGVFLVDDQYAPLTGRIREEIARLDQRAIRFVLNTHWHGDHTGGNENLGQAGALIVAHENVRRRMSTEQFIAAINERVPASPVAALPVVTFTEAVTFHLNGDSIHAFRVPPAHTDGDAIVHFRGANVVHMGDVFFNGTFPFVDQSSGGTVAGVIGAADRVLSLTNAQTRIIPGHGPLATRAELQAYRDMLVDARARVQAAMLGGRTLDQVKAARPLAPLEERWGRGFTRADAFVETLFRELTAGG
jgi:cyclase